EEAALVGLEQLAELAPLGTGEPASARLRGEEEAHRLRRQVAEGLMRPAMLADAAGRAVARARVGRQDAEAEEHGGQVGEALLDVAVLDLGVHASVVRRVLGQTGQLAVEPM